MSKVILNIQTIIEVPVLPAALQNPQKHVLIQCISNLMYYVSNVLVINDLMPYLKWFLYS